jgi:large subunit ribosomal protein L10e
MPHADLHQFRMGVMKDDYDAVISLTSQEAVIIRDNAIESARMTSNKYLENNLNGAYYFVVKVFPHHIVRENKMISGAGADRLQKGMRRSFGRPTDKAARLNRGTELFVVYTYKANLDHVKKAFDRATRKLSGRYKVVVQ